MDHTTTDEIVSDASPSSHLPLLSLCDPIDFLSDCHCAALAQRFLAWALAEPIGQGGGEAQEEAAGEEEGGAEEGEAPRPRRRGGGHGEMPTE